MWKFIISLLVVAVSSCGAIVFNCQNGLCNSDDIKISGNEITIRLQDFDDHIEFNDSEISIISRVVVSMPENINTLILQAVRLSNIQPMALKQFYNLNTLNLADNKLSIVDEKMLSGLANLRWLFLSHNRLTDIHSSAFNAVSELEYLNISHNSIEYLDKRVFANLKKLEAIYLDFNRICNLPKGIFERNRALKFVDLSHNQLKMLHLTFHDSIFMLNLAANQLITFKIDFKVRERENDVAILKLENNKIRDLLNITSLKISFELNLAGNQILYHPHDITVDIPLFCGFKELWSLNLSDTNFHFSHQFFTHDNPFGQMPELKELDLSYNQLHEVDFKNLRIPELRSLHLTGNNLTEIDVRNLKKVMPNLRNLEISENNWNCSYLNGVFRQIEKIPQLEVTVRQYLQKKFVPNVQGVACFNGTSMGMNEVIFEMDHHTRIQLLENKIDELFTKLTEALEIQQNFSKILRNLTKNEYDFMETKLF